MTRWGWWSPLYAGLSARAVFLRGWHAPRIIRAGESYAGVETQVMLLGFSAFVSGCRRLGRGPGPGWVADVGVGLCD